MNDVIDCPIYVTANRGSKAAIVKVALPERYNHHTRCRIFVDSDMNGMTIVMDKEGPFTIQKLPNFGRPVVLITKAVRQLFIDPTAISGVKLKGICYGDRVEFVFPDSKRLTSTKHGFEVL